MRALWSSRQSCSHNVSQKLKRIRRFYDRDMECTQRVNLSFLGRSQALPFFISLHMSHWPVSFSSSLLRSLTLSLSLSSTHLLSPPPPSYSIFLFYFSSSSFCCSSSPSSFYLFYFLPLIMYLSFFLCFSVSLSLSVSYLSPISLDLCLFLLLLSPKQLPN